MIKFIQKYQKYFYIVITTVIVISFSFFGTSGAIDGPNLHEQVAFTALDGTQVSRGELEQMVLFLQSDVQDKRIYRHPNMAPNFLNDGVVQKDFLETGMANLLIQDYADLLKSDLDVRQAREKTFKPYVHPKIPFVAAEMVWNYVSPTINSNLKKLQSAQNPLQPDKLQSRIDLYLAERNFPAPYLTELLWRQQGQHEWLEKDENLPYLDLSLFGYHNLDDWFGPKFIRLVAEFIYNAALVAEKKGYHVSKEEAWADLLYNGGQSYNEMARAKLTGALSQSEYINLQLRHMGMDSARATKIWQKVLLFRRLFHDIANSQMIEPKTLTLPNAWASEYVAGDLYSLPPSLHLSDIVDLAEFEHYMASTSKGQKSTLIPSDTPISAVELAKLHPEFVEKRYLVALKQADLKSLEARISLKDTWEWETHAENFKMLKKEFADLGIIAGETIEERVQALDHLPDTMRTKVDHFARHQIARGKTEWVENALQQAESNPETLVVRLKGGKDPLPGFKDRKTLIEKLDKAPLREEIRLEGDDAVFQVQVLDRSPDLEIASFAEVKQSGALAESLNKVLEPYYQTIKTQHDDKFKKEAGGYRNFNDVKRQVAELWLAPKWKEIKEALPSKGENLIPETLASQRFVAWAEKVKGAADKSLYIRADKVDESEAEKLPQKAAWDEQFKWQKIEKKLTRSGEDPAIREKEKLFHLKAHEWSPILLAPNGNVTFFYVNERKGQMDPALLAVQTLRIRSSMGEEAEKIYMKGLLAEIKEKKAISFDYMNPSEETMEAQAASPNV